ncbi:hypothetical protein AMTRI_Chr03g47010 [Amborella trichopoda]
MDQRVEKLKDDVSSLNLFEKLSLRPANIEPEVGENLKAPFQNHGVRPGNSNGNRQNGSQQFCAPKLVKLDFPRFNGEEDMTSWTCRVDQIFQFHQRPEEEHIALTSFHLEGVVPTIQTRRRRNDLADVL